jgi:hypothetical protein
MKLPEVRSEVGLGPVVGIRTVPSARVVVVSIYFGTARLSRDKKSDGRSLVVDCVLLVHRSTDETVNWRKRTERHHYPSIAELLIDGIDVLNIWPFNPRHAVGVFILGLETDHWSTLGDLSVGDDPVAGSAQTFHIQGASKENKPSNVGNVVLCGLKIPGLIGSQDIRSTREPPWEPSTRDLGID